MPRGGRAFPGVPWLTHPVVLPACSKQLLCAEFSAGNRLKRRGKKGHGNKLSELEVEYLSGGPSSVGSVDGEKVGIFDSSGTQRRKVIETVKTEVYHIKLSYESH